MSSSTKVHLETDRLLLRNVMAEDGDFLVRLWTDPEVTRYMGGPRDEKRMREAVEADARNPEKQEFDLWTLVEKETGRPVGHCGLLRKEVEGSDEVELNYVLDAGAWGKGYATEISLRLITCAFEERKLESVIALIKPGNEASIRVAVKAGMWLDKEVTRQGDIKMLLYRKNRERPFQAAPAAPAPSIGLRDENVYPDNDVLKSVLNESFQAYEKMLELFAEHGLNNEWRYYRDGKAWLCKVQKKKKTMVWMSAWNGFIQATIYFPERYFEKVLEPDINETLKESFRSTGKIGKSRPCTFQIKDAGIPDVFVTVMKYKMECK